MEKIMHKEYENSDKCIICGAPVPEGTQICPNCVEEYIKEQNED